VKWYKTFSATPRQPWFQALRDREGADGVESLFYLECFFADQYEAWGTWTVRLPAADWCRILRRNSRTLQKFLRSCREVGLLEAQTKRNFIEIKYRNLLGRKDNATSGLEGATKPQPSSDPENPIPDSVPEQKAPASTIEDEEAKPKDKRYRAYVSRMMKKWSVHDRAKVIELAISIHRGPLQLYTTVALVLQAQTRPDEIREKWLVTASDLRLHPPLPAHEEKALDLIVQFNKKHSCQVSKNPDELTHWQHELTGGVHPPARR